MCYLFHNKIINSRYKKTIDLSTVFFIEMLKHTNVLQAERYYFLAVHIYSLNLSLTNK